MRMLGSRRVNLLVRRAGDAVPSFQSGAVVVRAICVSLVALVVAACAAQLAPAYDRVIFESLTKANEEGMTLYASVAGGAPKGTFSKRQSSYDGLIGKLDALRLQVSTRTTPQSSPVAARIASVVQRGGETKAGEPPTAPTLDHLDRLIKNVTLMRNTDERQGLMPGLVVGFKREFEILMEQALFYEKALQR